MVAYKGSFKLLSGNEMVSYGALHAGANFYAGYPITPSTEIAEMMAKFFPVQGYPFMQMEDEIASIGVITGASLAGSKAFTATSGPGISLMQETIGFASITEVPLVIINVMRGGPSTGLPTKASQGDVMQARWGTHGDHPIFSLVPNSVQECYELTIKGFNLSEKYRVPTIILSDEIIGHMREKVVLPECSPFEIINRKQPSGDPEQYKPYEADADGIPPMAAFGDGHRFHVTGLVHDESGFPTAQLHEINHNLKRLMAKMDVEDHPDLVDMEEFLLDDADIVFFAYGSVSRTAKFVVRQCRKAGVKAGLLRPRILWPFPHAKVRQLLKEKRIVVVPELNYGQIVSEVKNCLSDDTKLIPYSRIDGELIFPNELLNTISAEISK